MILIRRIVILFIILLINNFQNGYAQPSGETRSSLSPIHIFFENIGTAPQVGGMIQYVQLPEDEIKVIGWHRIFPPQKLDLLKNKTHIIELPRNEQNYAVSRNYFIKEVLKILEKYPNHPLIIYTGIYQSHFIANLILKTKGREIKHIHIYEDGFFNFIASKSYIILEKRLSEKNVSQLHDYLIGKTTTLPPEYPFAALYPVTYHVAGAEELNQPKYKGFRDFTGDHIEDFDIYKIRDKLTPAQKEKLCQISNLDCSLVGELNKKTVFLFATGHVHEAITNRWKQIPKHILHLLAKAKKGDYGNVPQDAVWIYKLHPSLGITDLSPFIKKNFPDMIEIPAPIPFEILIIEGLNIQKVFASGSSFFYWIKPKQVLKYISHPLYDNTLLSFGNIKKEDIIYPHIDLDNTDDSEVLSLKHSHWQDLFYPSFDENYYCRGQKPFACGFLNKQSDSCLDIKWDTGKTDIFCMEEEKRSTQTGDNPSVLNRHQKIYQFKETVQK